ncbi:hypothetical protein [Mongoliitalea daihaiensis]|uniref:hypothetical protein n=1 Tax=Mongoliitalea daihaiensis TaxID=2782006 RepID=UPI001F44B783|nr:hypothetical protein [Mongoliitalea daihaiensis]UJP64010.1 hypothetical protein IPZ59_14435 [Mongoliitalea daihaiensis]
MFGERKLSLIDRVQLIDYSRKKKLASFYDLKDSLKQDIQEAFGIKNELESEMKSLASAVELIDQNISLNEKTIGEIEKIIG